MGIYKKFANIDNDVARNWADIKPYQLSIGITPKCNSKCEYCNNWKDKTSATPSEEIILKIIEDAKSLGVEQVLFSGGEPLLHKDFIDIHFHTRNMDLDTLLITNGTMLTDNVIQQLINCGCKKVGISLDCIDHHVYKQVRGIGNKKIIENIELIINKYKELNLSICCTLHKLNVNYLEKLLDFCMKREIPIQFQPIDTTSMSIDLKNKYQPDRNDIFEYERIFKKILMLKDEGYPIYNESSYLQNICNYFEQQKFIPIKCYAPFTQISINQEMKLLSCWGGEVIGDLRESSLYSLWNSNKLNDFRKKSLDNKCEGCYYSCHLSKSYNKII
ncbi:radical SAM protein [Paenibacillus zanthoxyli]|uniref:radical SAM protein n=1 Tax=Paenibacillus zanthoxyli TaxID=369399 RepID=UPI0004725D47|nr:radical SAM protein [Paenibacillus zanthoxyli]